MSPDNLPPVEEARLDHQVIYHFIAPGSRVLDLGCGDGTLMQMLAVYKNARVQGIEINDNEIYKCVSRGVSVFHGDLDSGLADYPDKSFDYIIINQSLQEVLEVELVLNEGLRVGKYVIVGFSNFAYYRARLTLFFSGRVPVTESLPNPWYSTPNLHFLSIRDFEEYCTDKKIEILSHAFLSESRIISFLPNLFALSAIFVVTRKSS